MRTFDGIYPDTGRGWVKATLSTGNICRTRGVLHPQIKPNHKLFTWYSRLAGHPINQQPFNLFMMSLAARHAFRSHHANR